RILYNFSGSACEGYSSDFRQVSELDSGEGKNTLSDLRSTSWEDGAGKSYRFKIDTRMNDAEPGVVDGIAERTGDHVTVKLKLPVTKTDRKSTRLNSSHEWISYAVFCLKKKKRRQHEN